MTFPHPVTLQRKRVKYGITILSKYPSLSPVEVKFSLICSTSRAAKKPKWEGQPLVCSFYTRFLGVAASIHSKDNLECFFQCGVAQYHHVIF